MADTIFALSSGQARAGVAVIRISGGAAGQVCQRLTRQPPPLCRRVALRRLVDPADGAPIDQALVLFFRGPKSFTGEDVLELHVHGSPAVIAMVLAALEAMPTLRPADPGEFTRRAFDKGRLDLTAAEGLADLIAAETRQQALQAQRQLAGELGRLYESWRARLLRSLALLEAEIDFGADEELPENLRESVMAETRALRLDLGDHLADSHRGQRLRDGFVVAVVGPPNAGKSSLVNRLARRDVAIVASRPGTTRDVLEVALDLDGFPVVLCDMAGLREASDEIEAEGVRRALDRAKRADLKLVIFDGAHWPALDVPTVDQMGDHCLVVVNKADLLPFGEEVVVAAGREALAISCQTGEGIDQLIAGLTGAARNTMAGAERPVLTRARHRHALLEAAAALDHVLEDGGNADLAMLAEDLRLAMRAIGRITGRVEVEEILGEIFAEFCIGK